MADYISIPIAALRSKPSADGPLISQLLYGEDVRVQENDGDWLLVENIVDRHTGYVRALDLKARDDAPDHVVKVLSTGIYANPNGQSSKLAQLSFLSKIKVLGIDGDFAKTSLGFILAADIHKIDTFHVDPVATARLFLGITYKWGGRSALGIDCSALVQLPNIANGHNLPRNAAAQCKVLDNDVRREDLQPGDLLFVPGHVMMSLGGEKVIHANGIQKIVCEASIDEVLGERGKTSADLVCKQQPSLQKMIDRAAFLALSGPDIMS